MSSASLVFYSHTASRDRLKLTMIVATALHAVVILGVGFGWMENLKESDLSNHIEVTLVNTQTEKAPDEAEYIAQANQEGSGGGTTDDRVRPETILSPLVPSNEARIVSPTPPIFTPPREQRDTRSNVMTVIKSEDRHASDVEKMQKQESDSPSLAQLISSSMEIASLEVEVGRAIQAYSKMPKREYISARTREHVQAAYMHAWVRKVEALGNEYFPAEAKKRNLSGSLVLEVIINPNGTVADIVIRKSSGVRILDDAAIQTVRRAAPFAPIPDEILKKDIDQLVIVRTWQYRSGQHHLSAR
ncbi:MAG: energy transducer TonB [Gammaproteobacteria bacterium]|nr:energy transducer TonB [Gammaproteobacteria bacterium]MDH5729912.1 energy transducer TonB [Gammaproteobacteria bacterium]